MIAEPNSSEPTPAPATTSFLDASPLSADELYQLTLYKWRYSLEAYGFDQAEVRQLMFLKWLYASHRLQG
ncbi:MAG: hypothetical protein JO057_11860 [Chloroflexi bacterium]|nr:hypothetical protein [Chloroflexota bacterium]